MTAAGNTVVKRVYAAATEAVEELLALARTGRVTLLFAAKAEARNNAAALRDHLLRLLRDEAGTPSEGGAGA